MSEQHFHPASERGGTNIDWLESYHTFNFGHFQRPDRQGFGALLVINDDSVAPNGGFATHGHRDMEIISLPLAGVLRHQDSLGNEHIIAQGEVQLMSAGTGIRHSEYNHSSQERAKFLQIWVLPETQGLEPSYQQKSFDPQAREQGWQLLISPTGAEGSLRIHQQAYFFRAYLEAGAELGYQTKEKGHGVYLFLIEGAMEVGETHLGPRDGLGVVGQDSLVLRAHKKSDILLMEVPLL